MSGHKNARMDVNVISRKIINQIAMMSGNVSDLMQRPRVSILMVTAGRTAMILKRNMTDVISTTRMTAHAA